MFDWLEERVCTDSHCGADTPERCQCQATLSPLLQSAQLSGVLCVFLCTAHVLFEISYLDLQNSRREMCGEWTLLKVFLRYLFFRCAKCTFSKHPLPCNVSFIASTFTCVQFRCQRWSELSNWDLITQPNQRTWRTWQTPGSRGVSLSVDVRHREDTKSTLPRICMFDHFPWVPSMWHTAGSSYL